MEKKFFIVIACVTWIVSGSTFRANAEPAPPDSKMSPPDATKQTLGASSDQNQHLLLVDDFDSGAAQGLYLHRRTSIGAYHGTFAKRPSYALMFKTSKKRIGHTGRALGIQWSKTSGWCGYYTLLENELGVPADVTRFNALCFMVKGEKGGERFDVGFADKAMNDQQANAFYVGDVGQFLKNGVGTQWQEVKIPLSLIDDQVDLSAMGSVVFFFPHEGSGKIYVENIMFRNDGDVLRWEQYNVPQARGRDGDPRGLWVWKVDPAHSPRAGTGLLAFCKRAAVGTLFHHVAGLESPDQEPGYLDQVQAFVESCHAQGIQIDAVSGSPAWALPEHHGQALDWLERVLDYNRTRTQAQRIDGVVLDVEPYLLNQWVSQRRSVKQQFLELLAECRKRADAQRPPLTFGAAVPMSFEQEEARDGFVSSILGHTDFLVLMAYRDSLEGILEPSRFLVDLASRAGKKVWVGVETQDLVSTRRGLGHNTFWEEGWVNMEHVLEAVQNQLKKHAGYGGVAIHSYASYRAMARKQQVVTRRRDLPEDSNAVWIVGPATNAAVRVDGALDEWKAVDRAVLSRNDQVAYNPHLWEGVDDLGARVGVMHDDKNLYVAFEVTDDLVVQNKTGKHLWEGDHVELWLDVDLMGDFEATRADGDDIQFGFSPGNFRNLSAEAFIFTPDVGPDDLKQVAVASLKTGNGYTIEAAIPKAFLLACLQRYTSGLQAPPRVGVDPNLEKQRPPVAPGSAMGPQVPGFSSGALLGIAIEPSDCDHMAEPQKCLMSTSKQRVWGDPTRFGFLRLE